MDEAETRQQLIDKKLLLSGWNIKDPSLVTEELPIERGSADRIKQPRPKKTGDSQEARFYRR